MTDGTKVTIVTQNNVAINRTSGKSIEFRELFVMSNVLTHMMDIVAVVCG